MRVRPFAAALLLPAFLFASLRVSDDVLPDPSAAALTKGGARKDSVDGDKAVHARKSGTETVGAACKRPPSAASRRAGDDAVLAEPPMPSGADAVRAELGVPKYLRSFLRGTPSRSNGPPA